MPSIVKISLSFITICTSFYVTYAASFSQCSRSSVNNGRVTYDQSPSCIKYRANTLLTLKDDCQKDDPLYLSACRNRTAFLEANMLQCGSRTSAQKSRGKLQTAKSTAKGSSKAKRPPPPWRRNHQNRRPRWWGGKNRNTAERKKPSNNRQRVGKRSLAEEENVDEEVKSRQRRGGKGKTLPFGFGGAWSKRFKPPGKANKRTNTQGAKSRQRRAKKKTLPLGFGGRWNKRFQGPRKSSKRAKTQARKGAAAATAPRSSDIRRCCDNPDEDGCSAAQTKAHERCNLARPEGFPQQPNYCSRDCFFGADAACGGLYGSCVGGNLCSCGRLALACQEQCGVHSSQCQEFFANYMYSRIFK